MNQAPTINQALTANQTPTIDQIAAVNQIPTIPLNNIYILKGGLDESREMGPGPIYSGPIYFTYPYGKLSLYNKSSRHKR